MSEWIDNQLRELRQLRDDVQTVIDALDPPKPKRRYTRRKEQTPEQRELQANLRTSTIAPRREERRRVIDGERKVAYATSGGRQDG